MLTQTFIHHLETVLSQIEAKKVSITHCTMVQGGDISDSFRIDTPVKSYFLKTQACSQKTFFNAEATGLTEISETQTLNAPKVIATGVTENGSFLLMEHFVIQQTGDSFLLGKQLALMHRHTKQHYGFHCDNYIGLSLQKNTWGDNWLEFWLTNRLKPQFNNAFSQGYEKPLKALFNLLLDRLPILLGNHHPVPSLVHGDLWGGNKGFLNNGSPVIFDPACYYGDREVDIAMTLLFGGFDKAFFDGYHSEWPLTEGYKQRQTLYNLYHQLNHLNLFGRSYLNSCINSLSILLI